MAVPATLLAVHVVCAVHAPSDSLSVILSSLSPTATLPTLWLGAHVILSQMFLKGGGAEWVG